MMSRITPKESLCSRGFLHLWRDITEYPDAFVEVCVNCSLKVIYHKDEQGRTDNRLYLRAHYRDFLQPYGATAQDFALVYGEKAYREAIRSKAFSPSWNEAGEEALHMVRELRKEKTLI